MRIFLFRAVLAVTVCSLFGEDIRGSDVHDFKDESHGKYNDRQYNEGHDEVHQVHEGQQDLYGKERVENSKIDEMLKEEIEESHDSKSDVDEDVDTAKKMSMFPPMHMPPMFPPMFLPPWFFMRPPPKFGLGNFFPPPGYLKALDGGHDMGDDMDEDDDMDEHDMDEHDTDDFDGSYEGPEDYHEEEDEYDFHNGDDFESLGYSSYDQHLDRPYGKRLRQRRSLVDTFSVKDSDDFWQDIDGGMTNDVSQLLKNTKAGYAAYADTTKRLDHYGAPQHIGYIDTGRIKRFELSLPRDRAFGRGYDFNDRDIMDSFAFKPTGQRFYDEDLFEQFKSGLLPYGKRYIMHSLAITKETRCWIEIAVFPQVDCATLETPHLFEFDYAIKNRDGSFKWFFRSLHSDQIWIFENLNVNGVQEENPILVKYPPPYASA